MDGSGPALSVHVESRNGVTRLVLSGELDLLSVPTLRKELAAVDGDRLHAIMLDLRDLSFVDSTGLHLFLEARDLADRNGHRLLLVGARPAVRRLFELTGTEHLIDEREVVSVLDQFTGRSVRDGSGTDPGSGSDA